MKKLLFSCLFVFSSYTYSSNCPHLYPNGIPIVIVDTVELCNSFYVVLFDQNKNSAVFASERLVVGSAIGSANRVNSYRTDTRLKSGPKVADYAGSNYDRGHIVPADDASSPEEMRDTFLMSNMTPQDSTLNRQAWTALELKIRKYAIAQPTDVYVVNIPIYNDLWPTIGASMIPVPIGYWKFSITPTETIGYFAGNTHGAKVIEYKNISVNQILSTFNEIK